MSFYKTIWVKEVIFCLVIIFSVLFPLTTNAAIERKPDLMVLGVSGFKHSLTMVNEDEVLTRVAVVSIMNIGGAVAEPFAYHQEWLTQNGEIVCASTGFVSENLGISRTNSFQISCIEGNFDRAIKVRISLDKDIIEALNNQVVESNENNNIFTKDIPLPDLKVLSISNFKYLNNNLNEGRIADMNIINIGRGSAGNFVYREEWLDKSGNIVYSSTGFVTGGLGVSRTSVIRLESTPEVSGKVTKVRVTLDQESIETLNNKVAESNENNNTFTKDIPLPDLKILGISNFKYLNNNFAEGLIADATIINIGRGAARSFAYREEWLDTNGNIVFSSTGFVTGGLGVSRTAVIHLESTPEVSGKVTKVRVTLDQESIETLNNQVTETNEINNTFVKDIPRPDLKIEGMNFKGSGKLPEITIINNGKSVTGKQVKIAYDWFDSNGDMLGGCYGTINALLGINKRVTQKNIFCGNEDTYKWATKFKATVDVGTGTGDAPQSEIVESNENNNSLKSAIPGRANLVRVRPVETGSLITNSEMLLPNTPSVTVPSEVLSTSTTNIPTPETPIANIPNSPNPIVVVPDFTSSTSDVIKPSTPLVKEEIVRTPNFTVNITQDGNSAIVTGKINYYGKGSTCTGPRYYDPVIVRWGDGADEPKVMADGSFSAQHDYTIKNKSYELTVSVYNSCYGLKTEKKTINLTF